MRWLKQTYDSINSEDIEENTAEEIRDFLTAKKDRDAAAPDRHPAYSSTNQPLTLQGSESPVQFHHPSPKPKELPKVTSLLESFDEPSMTPYTIPKPPPGRSAGIPCMDTRDSLMMQRLTDQFSPQRVLQASEVGETTTLKKQLEDIFGPFVNTLKSFKDIPAEDWVRAATWWALKGNEQMEAVDYHKGAMPVVNRDAEASRMSIQGAVNLAKAWWICHCIIPELGCGESLAGTGLCLTLIDQYRCAQRYLEGLTYTISTLLETKHDQVTEIDVDRSLWIMYPSRSPKEREILCFDRSQPADTIPPLAFGDTDTLFSYGSEFVSLMLLTEEADRPSPSFECVLSFIRFQSNWEIVAVLASQTAAVYIEIHSSRKRNISWHDVYWDATRSVLQIMLDPQYIAQVQLTEQSFKMVWQIAQQIMQTESLLVAGDLETLVFEDTVGFCHYVSHDRPSSFPSRPVAQCQVRLFERFERVKEGTIERRVHCGFRLFVTTPPQAKTISKASHHFSNNTPLLYGIYEDDNGFPGLLLQLREGSHRLSISLTCYDRHARSLLHALLSSASPQDHEAKSEKFPIRSLALSEPPDRDFDMQSIRHLEVGESMACVIEEKDGVGRSPYGNTVWSETLRVIIETSWGSITDRINLAPSHLRIGLCVLDNKVLNILRSPQSDMTICIRQDTQSDKLMENLTKVITAIQAKFTLRRIEFNSIEDLHKFQQAITGYKVRFDRVAKRFIINRPRKLFAIRNHWEANITRVQLVQQKGKFQLIAFFYQSPHGNCMNFEVRCTEDFQPINKNDLWGLVIKDAKFALPEIKPHLPGFVCLDELDYPLEHDDISIMFNDKAERDELLACLPGYGGEA
ncbi:hypothetical protein ABOM_009007 [Aspergillus bombycis]|uniref:Uncharacterized protein n=1 Tax=Aspergillus bombycis TaxID=109264 RepID=A0A1F7ZUQ5_9EURO|nr:hypothetical protein ABOM_009007 [Aspergillus bombycis]OGM42815.1 hypothetical protein ABOM_009007 [Aspergillus bombycis]